MCTTGLLPILPCSRMAMVNATSADPEKHREEVIVTERVSYSSETKALSRKQLLSPYFTIAAAAFGLISDGCKQFQCIPFELTTKPSADQNNLMTMANVKYYIKLHWLLS